MLQTKSTDACRERIRLFVLKLLDEGLATPISPTAFSNAARLNLTPVGKAELRRIEIEVPPGKHSSTGKYWTRQQYLAGLGFNAGVQSPLYSQGKEAVSD